MKTRYNTFDIICGVTELQKLIGQRLNQIYDIDNKTYLFRFQGCEEEKVILLIESGIRFHTTAFEWQKNMSPSGFCMKLRKHLKNKRLENLHQLGNDRIVDFQFGVADAAYHVILELYDRGNIILTDSNYVILYILRPHTQNEIIRFAVREVYPKDRAKQTNELSEKKLLDYISSSKEQNLRRCLMPILDCGPALMDHVLKRHNLENRTIQQLDKEHVIQDEHIKNKNEKKKRFGKQDQITYKCFDTNTDMPLLLECIKEINDLILEAKHTVSKGYIIQTIEDKPTYSESNEKYFRRNVEFHPYHFAQFIDKPVVTYDSFMVAVDEFYSSLEAQKIDIKTIQQERDALKKLSNVKEDHLKRLKDLNAAQQTDIKKAELITCNQELVDNAILAVQSAIASQLPWSDIYELVKEAQVKGDPVASCIKQLKLEVNNISLCLKNIYDDEIDEMVVDVDLSLSAWANARKYYNQKRSAAHKEQKTIDASQKALKSAEKKTQQTLKDVRTISTISKARKVYWFEKFYWFLSSENYLVVGGRDAQQNELIVKRYMRTSDIYVHAEIQGASSVIIRNPSGEKVPPKTLLEAGTMAISYSVAWDAKVVTNVYWVQSDQVSKTAPSGEYLPTGSFMIRGKKNFLPSCNLIMGLSLLFKLEDSFVAQHLGERKVRGIDDEISQCDSQLLELNIIDECSDGGNPNKKVIENHIIKNQVENGTYLNKATTDLNNASEVDFPDTQVNIDHCTGEISIMSDPLTDKSSEAFSNSNTFITANAAIFNSQECTIITPTPLRKKQQQNSKKRKETKSRKTENEVKSEITIAPASDNSKQIQVKRGQKGKLKKIKLKYRNQDEEERELRMMILNSSGKDNINQINSKANTPSVNEIKTKEPFEPKSMIQKKPLADGEEADDVPVGADEEIINTLTGQPFDNDELLFVIPVVAPYQSLQNYKFKVKLTPGTGKRGRAAKMALALFSKDKSCSVREKDLLKSIKEEALARNIPGKVKLSAPQMQKLKN